MALPPRQAFDNALLELQQDILHMGSLVEEAISLSVKSLVNQDQELADTVIVGDTRIDDMEIEIEEECIRLLATQQPMARDLRKISAAFKIIGELERMGDLACDVARHTKRIGKEPFVKPLIDIPRMAEITQKMVRECLDAYVREDVELARAMTQDDDLVDHLHSQIFREMLTYMIEDPRTIAQGTHLLFIGRFLERMADHATNVGERVLYMVTGERAVLND